jgi:hypothetical protein
MKKSDFRKTRRAILAMQPTPRRGVLDEEKKANVLLLIASGLSRREAAGYVQCAHTTIGRTAARDGDFATKLAQAEANSHVAAVSAIRGAMRDPKYWRAAAWMLERRSPEEYARRDPNSFTADQVMSLLARLFSESLPLLPEEKAQQFQELFDEALDEVEAKSCRTELPDNSPGEKRTHPAPRDGLTAGNGHVAASHIPPPVASAHSGNGHHHRPDPDFGAEPASSNGKDGGQRENGGFRTDTLDSTPSHGLDRFAEHTIQPPCSTHFTAAEEPDGGFDRAKILAELAGDLDTMVAAKRFLMHREASLDGDGPLFAAPMRKILGRAATTETILSPGQLHRPFHQGDGADPDNGDRNPLCVNDLQQQSTNCTNPENTVGRCNNGVPEGDYR